MYVQYFIDQHQMELGGDVAVKTAAALAQQMAYSNKVPCSPVISNPDGAMLSSRWRHACLLNVMSTERWRASACHNSVSPCLFLSTRILA